MLDQADIEAIAQAVAAEVDPPRRALMRAEAVAELLDVSVDWVYAHQIELRAVKLGDGRGPVRFDPADIDDFIDRRRAGLGHDRARPGPSRRPPAVGFELLPLPGGP